MKKSEAYNLAQIAVITSPAIAPENKLEILRILMDAESFEKLYGLENTKKAADEE